MWPCGCVVLGGAGRHWTSIFDDLEQCEVLCFAGAVRGVARGFLAALLLPAAPAGPGRGEEDGADEASRGRAGAARVGRR